MPVLGRDRANALAGDVTEEIPDRSRLSSNVRLVILTAGLAWSTWPDVAESGRLRVRDAWRGLRAAPATTGFALLVLTLAMASATVTFSIVDAVVLRPLPFDRSGDLVVPMAATGTSPRAFAPQEVLLWPGHVAGFESWAALRSGRETLQTSAGPAEILSATTTASLFDVLRVRPIAGRFFTVDDEASGAAKVAVISAGLWQRLFGADPAAIGRRLDLGQDHLTIVGVMPAGFEFPVGNTEPTDLWQPYVMTPEERAFPRGGLSSYLTVIARLRPGVAPAVAAAEMTAATEPIITAFKIKSWTPRLVPLYDSLIAPYRLWMLMALFAVGAVLLVAAVNVANLLLMRGSVRARELAVRAALGASRRDLVQTMVVESLLLSVTAAALGLVVSLWGIAAAKAALPVWIPRLWTIGLDLRVFATAMLAAVVTGLVFGVLPAWQVSRVDVVTCLKNGGASPAPGRRRWRAGFLVAEITLSSALLVAVTLDVVSFIHILRTDLGFDRSGRVAICCLHAAVPSADVVRAFSAVAGVAAAVPFGGSSAPLVGAAGLGGGYGTMAIVAADAPPGAPEVLARSSVVTPDYFGVAGMRFLAGGTFRKDTAAAQSDVVLDDLAARRVFGSRPVVGATISRRGDLLHVVGVVAHVDVDGPEVAGGPEMYTTVANPRSNQYLLRIVKPFDTVAPALGVVARRFQSTAGFPPQVVSLDDAFARVTAERRFVAAIMAIFGLVAVFVGAAGIYGVMASLVSEEARDLAVRVALGAMPRALVRRVLVDTGRYVFIGLALGLPASWAFSRLLTTLLVGVRVTDATPYVIVTGIIAIAGLAAAIVPARRAARVDPIGILKAA